MSRDPSSLERGEAELRRSFARALALALALGTAACTRDEAKSSAPRDAGTDAPRDPCKPELAGLFTGIVDGATECIAWQRHACGIPADIHPVDGGCTFSVADCQKLCPSFGAAGCRASDASCSNGIVTNGSAVISCDFCVGGIGRRPTGLERATATAPLTGEWFAEMARLEAASVLAFVELRRALVAHGAPGELVRAVSSAIDDERRHARVAARLARRHGGRPSAVRVRPRALPSLEVLATENAVEGEVLETHGALRLLFAAERARDPEVRAAFAAIGRDETRHAALARALGAWFRRRLPSAARARVDERRRRAVAALGSAPAGDGAPPELGFPAAAAARALLAAV
ncbi:MAG TPA: hypothetical protein VHE30_11290 [Polyangiaceae bacterium]|nr:hypothetical protein [Polyangiaceae bacterium]